MAGRDQARDALRQSVFVQGVGHIEVQPRVVGRDRAAVHQLWNQVAQQVGGGVKAHQAVAALPVDANRDGIPRLQARQQRVLVGSGQVAYFMGGPAFRILGLAGVGNREFVAACQHQQTTVTRLAAAQRIEHGAVQDDALFADGGHDGRAFLQVRVLTEEFMGHPRILAVSAYRRADGANSRL
jgi:hypothetical protein